MEHGKKRNFSLKFLFRWIIKLRIQINLEKYVLKIFFIMFLKKFELFDFQISDVINTEKMEKMEQNFCNFLGSIPNGTFIFQSLPRKIHYYPLIGKN